MKERREIELDRVDLLLMAVIAVLSVVTLVLVLPMAWDYAMDNWSRQTWIAINVAAVVVLVLIRAWIRRGDREIESDRVNLLLLTAIAVLSVVTLVLVLPMAWGPKLLYALDVRNWSKWTWIAGNAAVVVVLVLIRVWMRRGE